MVLTDAGHHTGLLAYVAGSGQKNVDLNGRFEPYVWDEPSQSIRYSDKECEFHSGGYQVIREYGSVETLIDDQRFTVEYWDDPIWRVLDLFQVDLSVNQQEDYCVVTRHLSDGLGNILDIEFLFEPKEDVRLTFRLHVTDANLYRIRFQNTGIAGDLYEVAANDPSTPNETHIHKIVFDNIRFQWDKNEIPIHTYDVVEQAGGKKVDIFMGDFNLPANSDVIVSPATFGPSATTDDCIETNGRTAYEDWAQCYVGYESGTYQELDSGFRFTNVTIPDGSTISVGSFITFTSEGVTGNGCTADLFMENAQSAAAYSSSARPSQRTYHATSVPFDANVASGDFDSPELNVVIQQRIDDGSNPHVSGNDLSFKWMTDQSDGDNYQTVTENDAELTVIYASAYPYYVDNGGIGTGTDYAVDVPYPATVDENDILWVELLDADNDSFDTPSGWNKVDELTTEANASFAWYWKRATGSETGTETFTSVLNAGSLVAGVMARYKNCITSGTPYDVVGGPTRNGVTQSTSITLGSITTQGANRLALVMIGVEDNLGISQAANYTEDFEVTTDIGGDGSFSFQSQPVASAGVVGAETATTGNDYWGTLVLALIPAEVGGGTLEIDVADCAEAITCLV